MIDREWKQRTEAGTVGPGGPRAVKVEELVRDTGLGPLAVRACLGRGLSGAQAIRDFLSPSLERLGDPFRVRDMDRAVERLGRARSAGELVRVFGDYDVDGTTGAALMHWTLRSFGFASFDVRQPDRFRDGYGLNVGAVEQAATDGVRVLVTVDCGISSFAAGEAASRLGIDLIVVDHHQVDPDKGLPSAFAVVNPQRLDCPSGYRELCGCGLAFYLARALRTRGRDEGWWTEGSAPNLKTHLDLVVMATAADMVPLTGENHVLVRHGMEILKATRKPGVRALLEVSGVSGRDVSPGHLGFAIGPRINASGRMASASLAFELLTTEDPVAAARMAAELEHLNRERAELQNRIWDEVRARVEAGIAAGRYRNGVVVADAAWHEGVVGIVASRVTETFHRPAAVIALREDIGKGSVRSYGGRDVLAALRSCSELLAGFGGHRYAAGLSVSLDRVDELALRFDEALAGEGGGTGNRVLPLLTDGPCELDDLDLEAIEELELLGPFGPGNPEPVFTVRARGRYPTVLKGRHLKLGLSDASRTIEGIWFNAAEQNARFADGELEREAWWAAVPEINRFRGQARPSLRVKDRKPIA